MSAMLRRLSCRLDSRSPSAASAVASSARAEVILGNLAGSDDGGLTGLHSNLHRALSFSMGSLSFTLDSVVLR